MVTDNIQGTLAAGFDPNSLLKLEVDTQERLQQLSIPNYAGPDPNSAFPAYKPYIPKEYQTSDFLFKGRNNIDIKGLLNSDDPEKVKMGMNYISDSALSSGALENGFYDYIYKTNPTVEKLKNKGYGYDISKNSVQNEDRAYKAEKDSHWWVTNAAGALGKGLLKLPGQALIKAGSIGAKVAAIVDYALFENDEKDLLSAIGDNMFVRYIDTLDHAYKKEFLNSLETSDYAKSGFFKKLGYAQFWNEDAPDFVSYLLIARGLGGGISKALNSVGLKSAAGSGMSLFGNALRGQLPGKAGNVLEFITGARNISGVASYAANILNEATDESVGQYRKIKEDLENIVNPDTGETFTTEEIQHRASAAAALTFKTNLAVLAFSGGVENRWIQRAIGRDSISKGLKDIAIKDSLEAIEKGYSKEFLNKIAKYKVGKQFLYYGPEIATNILKEGYWEENAQTAATRLADMKYGVGYYTRVDDNGDNIERTNLSGNNFTNFFTQLIKQTKDASTWLGQKGDFEVSTAIGVGSAIGIGGSIISNKVSLRKEYDKHTDSYKFKIFKSERRKEEDARVERINKINNARENFLSFKDVFKEDGTVDKDLLFAKASKIAELETRFEASEDIENPIIKKDIQERLFSSLLLAHFDNGTYDQFKEKFGNRTEDELAVLGFTKDLIEDPAYFVEFGDKLKENYDNLQNLKLGNSASLRPEQFDHFESLLKSRLFELQSNSIINQNSVNRLNTEMKKYGDIFQTSIIYENLYKSLGELNSQVDKDGSLETQKSLIKDQLKDLQEDYNNQADILEQQQGKESVDKYNSDYQEFANLNQFQEKLNEQTNKYLHDPRRAVEIFRDEYNGVIETETDKEKKEEVLSTTDPEIAKSEEDLEKASNEVKEAEEALKKAQEATDTLANEETKKALEEAKRILEEKKKQEEEAKKAAEEIRKVEEKRKQEEEEKRKLTEKEKRKYDIVKSIKEFKSQDELDNFFNSLSEDEKKEHKDLFDKQTNEIKSVEDDNDITDEPELYPEGTDFPSFTILKTSSLDSDNRPGSAIEEDLKDNEYNEFRNRFLEEFNLEQDFINKGYKFILEKDTFEGGNTGNLTKENYDKYQIDEPLKGLRIVLMNPKGKYEKVSDLFPEEFKTIQDKNIQFYLDHSRNIELGKKDSKWDKMAKNRANSGLTTYKESIEGFKNEKNQLDKAIDLALKGEQIIINVQAKKLPNLLVKDSEGKIQYRNISDVASFTTLGASSTIPGKTKPKSNRQVIVTLTNGNKLKAYPRGISSNPMLHGKVKDILNKEYESIEDAKEIRKNFLHILFWNTVDRYVEIRTLDNGKFKLVPIIKKDGKKINDPSLVDGTRVINVSFKGLEGKMVLDGKAVTKEEYINLLKNSFKTADKIFYKKGKQYLGQVSSYIEYGFNDSRIIDQLSDKKEAAKSKIEQLLKLFPKEDLTPVGDAYIDKDGNFRRRVSTLKKTGKLENKGTRAANRGTLIDTLFRDFLLQKTVTKEQFIGNTTKKDGLFDIAVRDFISKKGPLDRFSDKFKDDLYNTFQSFKIHNPDLTYITDIPTLFGEIHGFDFAGTIDILAFSESKQEYYIIDLKTAYQDRKAAYKDENHYYTEGDRIQLNAYADLLEQLVGIKVAKIFTFPIQTQAMNRQYESATMSDNKNPLLPVKRVKVEAITKAPIEDLNQYKYKLQGDIKVNGTVIPKEEQHNLYNTIDQVIQDYLISVKDYEVYQEDAYYKYYTSPIIELKDRMGIEFTNVEDARLLNKYVMGIRDAAGNTLEKGLEQTGKTPNFESIHRELDKSAPKKEPKKKETKPKQESPEEIQAKIEAEKERISKITDLEEKKVAEINLIMSYLFSGVGEASANKIKEYADRILSGKETRTKAIEGLPKSFVDGIDSILQVSGYKEELKSNDNEVKTKEVISNNNSVIEEKPKLTVKKIGAGEALKEIEFVINSQSVTFDELSGKITVNGSVDNVPYEVIKKLYADYNETKDAAKIIETEIRTTKGVYPVFIIQKPNVNKAESIITTFVYSPNYEYLSTMDEIDEEGGLHILPEEFIEGGTTLSDIINIQELNC